MAKTQRRDQVNRRKARQTKVARATEKVVRPMKRVQVTLGDLIAAAFDTVGGEVKKVARVVSSPAMTLATGKHIVVVG
ncbi:chaperonin [Hyalangium gracile]|uniref:chaperonin n=1 Tax=Hyalangium gracile TaxID=394092 RepID=UPI001CC9D7CD|nr:chaperonin [Hyalangium gracile]